ADWRPSKRGYPKIGSLLNDPYLLQQNTEVGIFLAYISYHDELERSFLTAQKLYSTMLLSTRTSLQSG
ncbi:MAG: hypothetical protein ACLSHY_00005, partial [Bacteroides intestinalis]